MRTVAVAVLSWWLLALTAGPAVAQPAGADNVGIYFDEGATEANLANPTLYGNTFAYLVLSHATGSAVYGWECHVDFVAGSGYSVVTLWHAIGYTGSVWTPPDFAVGLSTPLPWSEQIVLMEITVFYTGGEARFYLAPYPVPSLPGQMVYLGDGYPDLRPMYPSSGSFDLPVACLGCEDAVSLENSSWGEIRRWYR